MEDCVERSIFAIQINFNNTIHTIITNAKNDTGRINKND